MDVLLTEAMQAAQFFLEKNGEFFPFAVTLAPDCRLNHAQGYTGSNQPDVAEIRTLLERGLSEGAMHGRYRAVAVVSNVTVRSEAGATDAIRVHLEHSDGRCVVCFLPYGESTPGAGATGPWYGQVYAEQGEPFVERWNETEA